MYTIQAIPTLYKGRRYRSRLEAKWAAFFDALRWKHEYEPLDFGPWSPDFAIETRNGPLYVEVKPIYDAHSETIAKMRKVPGEHLLVGVAPGLEIARNYGSSNQSVFVGWFIGGELYDGAIHDYVEPAEATRIRHPNGSNPWGLISSTGSYEDRISGLYDGDHYLISPQDHELTHIWAKATNKVQWRKPQHKAQ